MNIPKATYRQLGRSGLRVSNPILGAMSIGDKRWQPWVIEEDEALPLLKAAYDRGVRMLINKLLPHRQLKHLLMDLDQHLGHRKRLLQRRKRGNHRRRNPQILHPPPETRAPNKMLRNRTRIQRSRDDGVKGH